MPFGSRVCPDVEPIYHVGENLVDVLRKTKQDAERLTRRQYAIVKKTDGYFLRCGGRQDVHIDVRADGGYRVRRQLFFARVEPWRIFNAGWTNQSNGYG